MLAFSSAIGALLLGALGSLHCVGMCGPIALMLPLGEHRVGGAALYHLGKISGYAMLGAVAGAVGQTLAWAGVQQWLSVVLGVLILLLYVLPRVVSRHTGIHWEVPGNRLLSHVLGRAMQRTGPGALWVVGVLNSWLPCGLVYVALAGATVVGTWWGSAGFMALFGLGTAPLLIALMWLGQTARYRLRRYMRTWVPVGVGLMALLMIVRGLNLGIPYLSPAIDSTTHSVRCH